MLMARPHAAFSAGRLSRVVHPSSLAAFPRSQAATAAACRPSSGERRTGSRLLAAHVASKPEGCRDEGEPKQQSRQAAEAPPTPPARRRTKSSHTPVKDVPWNAATEAAVLQFWQQQGALLPEAEVQPEQQTEQRRLRSKILRWAANHPRHRDLEVLTDYMARVREAAAASSWADAPWRIALLQQDVMSDNRSPARVLQSVQAAQQEMSKHSISLSPVHSLMLAGLGGKVIATKAAELLLALEALEIDLDFTRVVKQAPTLLRMDDIGAVLKRWVAAMQQLDPQLDVARVFKEQPSLLTFKVETVAAKWAALQTASGLGDDDVRALVEVRPAVLASCQGVVGWKLKQLRAYELARNPAGAKCTPVSSIARMLSAASWRVWRLCYLCVAAGFQYAALTWVTMGEEKFVSLNPGYSSWLALHPIPPEAYQD